MALDLPHFTPKLGGLALQLAIAQVHTLVSYPPHHPASNIFSSASAVGTLRWVSLEKIGTGRV